MINPAATAVETLTLTPEQVQAYRRDGYLVVPDVIDPAEADAFVLHAAGVSDKPQTRGLQAHRDDDWWRRLAAHPRVVHVVRQLLGDLPQVVQTMYLNKPAGGAGHSLHQDLYYIPTEPQSLMACWIALSDTDGENGGLCVVPASHQRGMLQGAKNSDTAEHHAWEIEHDMVGRDGRRWKQRFVSFAIADLDPASIVRLTVPRGSAVFFDGKTVHGSFANKAMDRPRRAFATHYVSRGTWVFRCDLHHTLSAAPAPRPDAL
jgi:ectoine hydroxylase-related dioxygenase (phytanoyl-CoA dioxygenase family)